MKKLALTFIVLLLFGGIGSSQSIPDDSLYLGQELPGNTPVVFAPGIVSKSSRPVHTITFSPSGNEIFFAVYDWPDRVTLHIEYKNGKWTSPATAVFSTGRSVDEPAFSPDGNRVYYYAYLPNSTSNAELYYSEKSNAGWGQPVKLSSPPNSTNDEWHPSVIRDTSLYFINSTGKICYSKYINGIYQNRVILPDIINDKSDSYRDPYVAPDGNFIIFGSSKSGGFGNCDLYISFKKPDGSWTDPKNLGNKINTSSYENSADITPDGKYMTYDSKGFIYWAKIDNVLDSLKEASGIPIPEDSLYLAQTPPGNIPTVFELPVSSGLRPVERIAVSANGKEIYYGELDTWPATDLRIKCIKYQNDKWQQPIIVFEGYIAPALSGNDSILYMQKDQNGVACTYFSKRNNAGWSTPARLLSTTLQSHYFQETKAKNFYLASNPGGKSDLCKLIIHNTDTTIQSLGTPINTPGTENDFFIARDESYLIFFRLSSPYDLFISYNKDAGKWTNPKSLGIKINTAVYECCPYVTNDNKYLFFTRGGDYMDSYYTYWVKIDNLIDSLMHTNFVPYLNTSIPDQAGIAGQLFSYIIPDSTFIDDDGNNTLSYNATLANGNPLPEWLLFDAATGTFSSTEPVTGTVNIKVTATDTAGVTISTTFKIKIDPTAINQTAEQYVRVYPNPGNGLINLSLDAVSGRLAIVEIFNMEGKLIFTNTYQNLTNTTIDLNNNPKGIYLLKLIINDSLIYKKICIDE